MPIYNAKLKQILFGQNLLNDLYFIGTNPGTTAENLAADLRDTVIPEFIKVQNASLTHVAVEVVNIDEPADFAALSFSPGIAGLDAGDCMPTFVAWGFQKARNQTKMRHGSMRIAGVTESLVTDGVAISTAVTELAALGTFLSAEFTGESGLKWTAGYFGNPIGQPQPVFVSGTTWSYRSVTSQVSRKPGHGS